MGNKLCKKKSEGEHQKSPTPFDRIITRLHLRPNNWKSESDLNRKQITKSYDVTTTDSVSPPKKAQRPLSKSLDWTDADLHVPDEPIHLKSPKLDLIFNDNTTPTPPPRKHRQGIREKIGKVARTSLNAFQNKKPVEEPLCVKKTINFGCPLDEDDCRKHNKEHKHIGKNGDVKKSEKQLLKEMKRRKNLSVVSLPNYNELKFTVARSESDDEKIHKPIQTTSSLTLTSEQSKSLMTRCRSFGSLLPQQLLHKLKPPKAPADAESDDSFGPLEDWDLRILEHYNPKDASLPRPRKPPQTPKVEDVKKNDEKALLDVESMIVSKEEAEKPVAPVRRSESLLKKMTRIAAEATGKRKESKGVDRQASQTPPSSPVDKKKEEPFSTIVFPTQNEDGKVEHSNLLKLLEDFSVLEKQSSFELEKDSFPYIEEEVAPEETPSLTPSLVEFERSLASSIEMFLNTERANANKEFFYSKHAGLSLPQNAIATTT